MRSCYGFYFPRPFTYWYRFGYRPTHTLPTTIRSVLFHKCIKLKQIDFLCCFRIFRTLKHPLRSCDTSHLPTDIPHPHLESTGLSTEPSLRWNADGCISLGVQKVFEMICAGAKHPGQSDFEAAWWQGGKQTHPSYCPPNRKYANFKIYQPPVFSCRLAVCSMWKYSSAFFFVHSHCFSILNLCLVDLAYHSSNHPCQRLRWSHLY